MTTLIVLCNAAQAARGAGGGLFKASRTGEGVDENASTTAGGTRLRREKLRELCCRTTSSAVPDVPRRCASAGGRGHCRTQINANEDRCVFLFIQGTRQAGQCSSRNPYLQPAKQHSRRQHTYISPTNKCAEMQPMLALSPPPPDRQP